jgi:hypothetical protein
MSNVNQEIQDFLVNLNSEFRNEIGQIAGHSKCANPASLFGVYTYFLAKRSSPKEWKNKDLKIAEFAEFLKEVK